VNRPAENSSLSSRTAFWTGTFVLIFLVIHVNTFFVSSRFFPDGLSMHERVYEAFQSPLYVTFYLVALAFLAYHLKHGVQSAFQTFGLRHKKYETLIAAIAVLFWLIIPIAFAVLPLYFLLAH
jgi:succinate dehydrogenase / fumarate reductase cytochrome b subunit